MAVSLYDLSVTNYLQTLGAVEGFLAKSLSHFKDNKVDPNEVADVRLCARHAAVPLPDPCRRSHHSLGAIRGVQGRRVRAAAPRARRSTIAGLQKQVTRGARGAAEAEA